jgi:hypothetical protein
MNTWIIVSAIGLALVAWLFTRRTKPLQESPDEVATQIEAFVDNTGGTYDWDDFISFELADPYLENVRQLCIATNSRYPTGDGKGWCNEQGLAVLRQLAADVREYGRTGIAPMPPNSALQRTSAR